MVNVANINWLMSWSVIEYFLWYWHSKSIIIIIIIIDYWVQGYLWLMVNVANINW